MGFLKNLFKADREYEENLRKQTIENQVKTWEIQARMGQTPNVQADMEKIYGLDKLEQKQQQKQQTKEIVKSAVIGGIVAGDAGAVVGAMVAKNNIDNRNSSTTGSNSYSQPVNIPSSHPEQNDSQTTSLPYSLKNGLSSAIKYYESSRWLHAKTKLELDDTRKTGCVGEDTEYCLSKLGVALLEDLEEILEYPRQSIRPAIASLTIRGFAERTEYGEDRKLLVIWKGKEVSPHIDTRKALNYYGSKEWQEQMELIKEKDFQFNKALECLSELKVAKISDIAKILDWNVDYARSRIYTLIEDGEIERLEHKGRPLFIINNGYFERQNNVSNDSKFDEIRKFKDLLDSGIITQEEFDTKKKQLLEL